MPPFFKNLAQKFGLPVEHLDFFFENRAHFNWEIKEDRKIFCTIRGCEFSAPVAPEALVDHMITEHEYGQYPCERELCNFVAYDQSCLKKHNSLFHKRLKSMTNQSFACRLCPFTAHNRNLLDRHMSIHENRQFRCSYCNYSTVLIQRMQDHMRHHFRIRDYSCYICERSFLNQGHLTGHLKCHTKDYLCAYCFRDFTSQRNLSHHLTLCKKRRDKLS